MDNSKITPFYLIIDRFFDKIEDDLYIELTYEDTVRDANRFLINSIPYFKFPKFAIFNYDSTYYVEESEFQGAFLCEVSEEEQTILADLMRVAWVSRQLASIDNTKMKFSGTDFKLTSQANHMEKLIKVKKDYTLELKRVQSIYSRRSVDSKGYVRTNWSGLAGGVIK